MRKNREPICFHGIRLLTFEALFSPFSDIRPTERCDRNCNPFPSISLANLIKYTINCTARLKIQKGQE